MNQELLIQTIAEYLVGMELESHLTYAKVTAGDILAEIREAGFEIVERETWPATPTA